MKKILTITVVLVVFMCSLAGCLQKDNNEKKSKSGGKDIDVSADFASGVNKAGDNAAVSLKFWCDENEIPMFQQRIEQFIEENKEEAAIEITCEPVGASICKDTFLADTDQGADVFCLPDDQLAAMAAAGVLEEVPNVNEVSGRNLEGAVQAASVDERLYAYPLTADNGYFLYYDKRYFKESDVQTLEGILDVCAMHGKKFVMSWTSGWYLYSFLGIQDLKWALTKMD